MYETTNLPFNGTDICLYEWKADQPKAVICLIHGIGEYAGRYDRIGEFFTSRNVALLGFDLPGHGLSAGVRGHAAPRLFLFEIIDRMVKIAEEKYPELPLYIYGHSMGGNIALQYAREGKRAMAAAGYVISAPWLMLSKPIPGLLLLFLRIASAVRPALIFNTGLKPSNISNVADEVRKYAQDPMVHHYISAGTVIDGVDSAAKTLSAKAGFIRPLLLMHGSADRICSVEGSRRLAAIAGDNCTYTEWDGLYHEIHNEKNGDQVLRNILNWIGV